MPELGSHRFSMRPNRAHEVPWLEWGAEALERARAEGKPVLLSVSAVWCHWCHVMDETTYSDPRVIELLCSGFIPVRVDADVRPDLGARYNAGGWPTTAILDGDGEIIDSVTYVPPDPMVEMLLRVQEAWLVSRESISAQIAELRATRRDVEPSSGVLSPQLFADVSEAVDDVFDEEFGGFGDPPRFPHAAALRLLLYRHRRDGDPEALRRVRLTLGAMRGSLFDEVEGGWFRYATERDWSNPHYEKLAGDQGLLLLTLADLARSSPADLETAAEVAARSIEYVERTLVVPESGFYGSQDADEAYYALDEAGRARREPPYVDDRVYTASTAVLARGLLACGVMFRRPDWVSLGTRAVDFLWGRLRVGEAGLYHYWDGAPNGLGLLHDQAETALALLDAYEVTGAAGYLDATLVLVRTIETKWRDVGGGFWDLAVDHERSGLLAVRRKSLDDNAAVAEAFLRIGRLTHDEAFLEVARLTLQDLAGEAADAGLRGARYAMVVERLLRYEPEIKVVGSRPDLSDERVADLRAEELHGEALRLPLPSMTVQLLDPKVDVDLLATLNLPPVPRGVAYACVGTSCSLPVDRPEMLLHAVEQALLVPAT